VEEPLPALRAGLQLEDDAIVDPSLARRLRLDASFLAVARALPGPARDVAERAEVDPELVPRIASALEAHHLLDTPTARTHAAEAEGTRAILDHDPQTVPLFIRDDAAFTCTQCGSCCGGHNVGPVLPDTLDALEPHMPALATKARLDQSPFYTLPAGPDEAPSVLCRTEAGWCVFLSDDRKCTIHAALGGPAKPRICQLFPWEFKATPRGVAITISNECRGFAEARAGQPLADREADIRRLLRLVPGGRIDSVPALVTVAPGETATFAEWSETLDAMHGAIDAHQSDPAQAFVAMTATLGRARKPEADDTLGDELEALCAAMRSALLAVAEAAQPPTDQVVVRTGGIALVAEALETLPQDLRRALAPLERDEHSALFAALMHHRLASHALLEASSASHGLAWSAFGWLVGRASAIHRAGQVKRRHTVAQDLVDAVAPITFVLRAGRVRAALRGFDDAVLDLFFHRLEALVSRGRSHFGRDPRLELHASQETLMRLQAFWSTTPQKVRLALEELGLDYELVSVDLATGEQKRAEFLAIHPRGKVPALEIDGGVCWESNAALEYLGMREQRLWPSEPVGLTEALSLLHMESAAFQSEAGTYFFNRVVLPLMGKEGNPEKVAAAAKKIAPLLTVLEDRLHGKDYLLGDFTVVDCAFAPWLPNLDLDDHPNLRAWRDRLRARPSWAACEFTY